MMNKKIIYYCAIIFLAYGCSSSKNSSYKFQFGKYLQKRNPCVSIDFSKDSFEFVDNCSDDHLPKYQCCDTLAMGEYLVDYKRGLIELSSSSKMKNNSLYFEIIEKELEKYKDSLVFIFNNPIAIDNSYHKELIYNLQIFSAETNKEIKTDEVTISLEKIPDVEYFSISVFPKSDIALSNLALREVNLIPFYSVKNLNSNVFEINVPDLDYEFLARKRLIKDYIKIMDNNDLLWDGETYLREGKGNVPN